MVSVGGSEIGIGHSLDSVQWRMSYGTSCARFQFPVVTLHLMLY